MQPNTNYSVSVKKAISAFPEKEEISSSQIVLQLLKDHPEYGNKQAELLSLSPTNTKKTVVEWIEQVMKLFNNQNDTKQTKSTTEFVLHGRLFIIGLALIDSDLKSQLDNQGFYDAIVKELREPLEGLLATRKENLLNSASDSVPNQTDEPVIDIDEDLLGRAAFARFLARRIKTTNIEIGAYSIHLCGPWGSGKTTILNFLKSELVEGSDEEKAEGKRKRNQKWTIVDFNAWRNQHIKPPWWPLYSQIYETTKKTLGFWYSFKEFLWRLLTGQPFQLLILIAVFWAIALIFNLLGTSPDETAWASTAKNISEIIALASTITGAVIGFGRSLLFSSAKAAQNFQQNSHDPMKNIQNRFGKLAKRLNKRSRLAVFIDDLDRCKSDYVVSLLEGIQTLFRQGSVFFIVAADSKWLQTCFELVYKEFKDSIGEEGKPLGILFIEKTFQLTTPVPSIPKDFKAAFWNQLIAVKDISIKQELENVRKKAKDNLRMQNTDMEVLDAVEQSKSQPMYEQLAVREEAVVHLASPDIIARTEHTLKPFISLLDDNPRGMKRLVNAYSVNRARAILAFLNISMEDLAQWTIINMRWPQLAEYFAENPEMIDKIGADDLSEIDENMRYLFKDAEVINVINGGDITNALTTETIKICSKLL
jgi:DNA polymerase III delta prime subunit